jgi:hypothetical protein
MALVDQSKQGRSRLHQRTDVGQANLKAARLEPLRARQAQPPNQKASLQDGQRDPALDQINGQLPQAILHILLLNFLFGARLSLEPKRTIRRAFDSGGQAAFLTGWAYNPNSLSMSLRRMSAGVHWAGGLCTYLDDFAAHPPFW